MSSPDEPSKSAQGYNAPSIADSEATLSGPFSFEKSLQQFVKGQDEAKIQSRTLGVLFDNLRVVGRGSRETYQPTLGSVLNTLNPLSIFNAIQDARHPHLRDILTGFEGVIRPGEMLLVLGRPGAGCSTFLKTLANQTAEFHAVDGEVHYDSLSPHEIASRFRHDVLYTEEDDVHFPSLTVGHTLEFAADMRVPQARVNGQSRQAYARYITDMYSTVFGLKHVANTPVGDAAIRGVSGGEKKRVSISETFASRSLISAWDNSTRGLDSSTALEFIQALRTATDISRKTTIVTLYQTGESLYELFDKVALVYEGRLAYFGPANAARQYFIDMGYEPANRQTTADFLTAITDPRARIPRSVQPGESSTPSPRTAAEFVEYYRRSTIYTENRRDMESYRQEFVDKPEKAEYYRQSVVADHARHTRDQSAFTVSLPMQVRAVMKRRIGIIKGNSAAQSIALGSYIVQAIIMGTTFIFLPDSTASYFSRGGVIFFAIFLPALFTMAEIPSLFAERPIGIRHRQAALYHPFVEAIASTLLDIPIAFVTMMFYGFEIYLLTHGAGHRSASQFFIFFLFLFTTNVSMKGFYRALSAAFRTPAPAQAIGGLFLLELTLYTGYMIPIPSMIGALKWISYINPLRYAFEAAMANEFQPLHGVCTSLVPTGPGYENVGIANQACTVVGSRPGEATVSGAAYLLSKFGYTRNHLWRNYAIYLAFGVFFIAGFIYLSERASNAAGATSITLFKRGTGTASRKKAPLADAEALPSSEKAESLEENEVTEEKMTTVPAAKSNATPAHDKVFSWQHINYTVPLPGGKERQLLNDVSGYCAPGKLLALMGESGAGKTTLLNVLANRAGTGVVSGDRFVNGHPLPSNFQAQTGYCQQTDTHLPTQTVREALRFSARLRQPQSVSLAEKDAYAERCLEMCGMVHLADAVIGSLGVEYRKRTTIGVELAAKPQLLLFLDEPTSGLDSQSAWAIMQFLRELADQGQAILCTIHQPSAELFQVFDRLLLLRKGGQTVYFGDVGYHAETLINYFESNGSRKCLPDENPAEFILSVVGAGATATADRNWSDVWLKSVGAAQLQTDLAAIHTQRHSQPSTTGSTDSTVYATSWLHQTRTLTARGFSNQWRDPEYLLAKLFLSVVAGLFIGFTFYKAKDSLQGAQNKLFAVFMAIIISSPLGAQITVPFIAMRDIYEIRERPSRMYSWGAFMTSQLIIEVPWNLLSCILIFFSWYWTVGYDTDRAGFTFFGFAILFPLYFATMSLAVAAMSPTAEIAGQLFGFLLSFVLTFNGVTVPSTQLHWWKWMYHVSPYTYLISAIFGQVVGHQEMTCADNEYATIIPPSTAASCAEYMGSYISNFGGYLLDPNSTQECHYCSVRNTDQLLQPAFNIRYSTHWRDIGIFCGFIVFNTFAAYVLLYLFRIRTGNPFTSLKRRFTKKS